MKKYLFIFLIILNYFSSKDLKSEISNSIVLKIDKKIITSYEIKNKIIRTLVFSGTEINQTNIDNLKSQVLESLINLKLKDIQLEGLNLKASKQRIDNYIKSISKKNIEELKVIFKNYDLDIELFFKEIETELKWQQFIFNNYSDQIVLDEISINNEVDTIIRSNPKIKEVNLSEIQISKTSVSKNNDIIDKILEEIQNNGFENSAIKYSISDTASQKGNLGWVNIKTLSKKIDNIVENLKTGQISAPIELTDSILILKLNSKRLLENKDIDRENLKNNLINQRQNDLYNLFSKSHLSKLKNKYLIQYQ